MTHYDKPQPISESDFKDDQEAIWFYNFLLVRGWLQNDRPKQTLQNSTIRSEVIASIKSSHTATHMQSRNSVELLFSDIRELYESSLLKKDDYGFITKLDNRIQNAIWIYVTKITLLDPTPRLNETMADRELKRKENQYFNVVNFPTTPIYRLYTINSNPLSPAELTASISKFFQIWEAKAEVKRYRLGEIRELIGHIQTFQNAFKWLNKSSESQCSWAADYMNSQGLFQEQFPLSTSGAQYNAVVASFDSWCTSLEAKQLFLMKMKRTWSTKKYRDKQQGKKPYSFVMSNKISKMLDNLTAESDVSKSQLVEKLIMKEHHDRFNQ